MGMPVLGWAVVRHLSSVGPGSLLQMTICHPQDYTSWHWPDTQGYARYVIIWITPCSRSLSTGVFDARCVVRSCMHGMVLSVTLAPSLVPGQEVQLSLAWSSRTLHSKAMRLMSCGRQHSYYWFLGTLLCMSLPPCHNSCQYCCTDYLPVFSVCRFFEGAVASTLRVMGIWED